MTRTLAIGRIAGVPTQIHWTWVLIFGLVAWSLAEAVFPEQDPGLGTGTYWAMALVGTVVFFVSLLLHELGHAIQARREGMQIEDITLWLFGGVARFRGQFPSAGAEFRIAIAGPAVTAGLIVLYTALAALALPAAFDGVVRWLAVVNLVLLLFNMLPGLPLDGGRVARSLIWSATGDFDRATRLAAGGGQVLAYLLMGLGISLTLTTGLANGIWLAIIGWFLLGASRAELEQVTVARRLEGVTVRDLMVAEPVCAPAEMSLRQFLDEVVWTHRFTSYPVVAPEGDVIGLLAFRSLARIAPARLGERTVGQHAEPLSRVATVSPDAPAIEAIEAMNERNAGRALVFEGDRFVGLLSSTDLMRAIDAAQMAEGAAPPG